MIVVKYGGNAMADGPDTFIAECAELVRAGVQIVLVHGGGPQIDAALRERGIPDRRVAGLRVTDAATLDITEAVLCGTVNKALVRAFRRHGIAAVGLSGQDAGLLVARPMAPISGAPDAPPEDIGFVGEVEQVNPHIIEVSLEAGIVPIIAPLGVSGDGQQRYNLNADTAAGAIAGALAADPYVVITDVPRVRSNPHDPASGIDSMTVAQARAYGSGGAFDGGMLPKMAAIYCALEGGALRAIVAGGERPLHKALSGDGTVIVPDERKGITLSTI